MDNTLSDHYNMSCNMTHSIQIYEEPNLNTKFVTLQYVNSFYMNIYDINSKKIEIN